MRGAFNKDVLRSVTHSLGRFLAIAGIVALGTGFYAGLRMTAPDMKLAADQFYDGTNLMDIRVVSSSASPTTTWPPCAAWRASRRSWAPTRRTSWPR